MAAAAVSERTRGLCRAMPANYEVKDPESGPPLLYGHFVVFDEWTEIDSLIEGHFMEMMMVGSWDKTISEARHKFRCLFQHGEDPQMGRKPIGPIEVLEADSTGVYYEVPLFASVPDLIIEGLRAKQYGSSALFDAVKWNRTVRPAKSAHNPEGLEERVITETRGIEFGPCVFNLYEGATASARSETDTIMLRKLAEDPERFRAVARAAGISLDSTTTMAYSSASSDTTNPAATISIAYDMPVPRRYKRAAEAVGDTVWAVLPRTLEVIMSIIEERQRGYKLSEEEMAERIGEGRPSPAEAVSPVAVIPVGGTIMPHAGSFSNVSQSGTSIEALQQRFRAALADPAVESILFNVDSPGGSVELVPEMHAEMMAARGQKLMVGVANALAASAAYYLLCACDEVVVTPSGQVGSIGTYSTHRDVVGKQKADGVKTTLVSAGKNKVEGNPFEPLSASAKAEMQSRVNGYYDMFVAAVADGRGVTPDVVEADFGQGRMFLAADAVEAGLADTVATYDATYSRLAGKSAIIPTIEDEPELPVAATHSEPEPAQATTRPAVADAPWIYGQDRVEDRWTLRKRQ